jgi:cation diffusion facilitator family transporter
MASESRKTVLIALAANTGIAVAKVGAGLIGGSSAMLAEGAHSIADTTNQLFLLASLKLSEREPDAEHPFGYGKERFLWTFMAAIFIFVAGALFSFYEGLSKLLGSGGGGETKFGLTYAVLAIALVLEIVSMVRAVGQTRVEAKKAGQPLRRFVRTSRDPTTKTVVFEDGAAVAGILVALAGVGLHQLTGSEAPDAIAALAIGVLLAIVAAGLWRDTRGLLIGESALPEERERMRDVLAGHPEVDGVGELLTMALGPESLLVAARIDLVERLDSDAVERVCAELDLALREAVPAARHVFLDPTGSRERPVTARSGAAPAPTPR